MAKSSTTYILVFLVVNIGIFIDKKVDACYVEAIGGGCPDVNACKETCRPCYRNIGVVYTYCVAPGGGINFWRCRCDFAKGAPCPPPGGPTCPAPPPPGRDSHRKIGGRVKLPPTVFKYYDHDDKNVTKNVKLPILSYP